MSYELLALSSMVLLWADGGGCSAVGAVPEGMPAGQRLRARAAHAMQRSAAERAPLAGPQTGAHAGLPNCHVSGHARCAGYPLSFPPLFRKCHLRVFAYFPNSARPVNKLLVCIMCMGSHTLHAITKPAYTLESAALRGHSRGYESVARYLSPKFC